MPSCASDPSKWPRRTATEARGQRPNGQHLIEGVGFEQIWDCVTCGACMEECPVFIEHVPTIMDMRRYLVMEQANMPETAQQTLMQIEQRGHPWRGTQLTRTTWIEEMAAEGVEVPIFDGTQEYLYWVGCTGALQERNVKVTQVARAPAAGGGRQLRRPRPRGGLLRRPGAAPRQRVPLPATGRAEHRDLQREERAEGHRQLPPLLQHDRARVPAVRRHTSRPSTTPSSSPSSSTQGKLTPAATNGLSRQEHDLPRPLLPLPPQQHHRRAPLRPRRHRHSVSRRWGAASEGTFCCGAGGCTCGWRSAAASASTTSAPPRPSRRAPTSSPSPAPSACRCSSRRSGHVPAAEERGVQVFDLAELLEQSVAFGRPSANGGAPLAPEPASAAPGGPAGEGGGGGDADGLG